MFCLSSSLSLNLSVSQNVYLLFYFSALFRFVIYLHFPLVHLFVFGEFRVDENFNLDKPHPNCLQVFLHLLPSLYFSFKNLACFVNFTLNDGQPILIITKAARIR